MKLDKREQIIEMVKVLSRPGNELMTPDLVLCKRNIDSIELEIIDGVNFFKLNCRLKHLEYQIEDIELKNEHLEIIIDKLERYF